MPLNYLQNRSSTTLKSRFHSFAWGDGQFPERSRLLLSGSSDQGVIRNGGRRGTGLGPEAIISQLIKLQEHLDGPIFYAELANRELEEKNFTQHQSMMQKHWEQTLKRGLCPIAHIGGGHDHILPLLLGIENSFGGRTAIINIDPHLDTRIDPLEHSGNPFRLFAEKTKRPSRLWQIGTQAFANTTANYEGMEKLQMHITPFSTIAKEGGWKDESHWWQELRTQIREYCVKEPTTLVISLDADSIEAAALEAVSAPGPMGFYLREIYRLISWAKEVPATRTILGIYEYNPLYDNLSAKGARALAQLTYHFLQ